MPRLLAALVTVRDAAMRCELCGSCAVFDVTRLDGRIRLSRIGSGSPDGSGDAAIVCELRGTRTMFGAAHAGPDGRMHSSRIDSGSPGRFGDAASVLRASMDGTALVLARSTTLSAWMLLSLRTGDATTTGGS